MRHPFLKIIIASLSVLLLTGSLARAQQGETTSYVYDEDGRLHAVISPTGEAAVYEYDAAGNFTGIRRLTPNDLELLTFTPRQGSVGTPVTIYGTGFNQGVNSVSFNGVTASIVRSNIASVVALVPHGATTGLITVVTPRGAATSAAQFVVRGVLLTPQAVTIPASDSVQFGLSISGTPTGDVVWSVNGSDGGGLSVGTITADGFYTAPNLAGSNTVQYLVRATSVDDSTLFGEAVVTVVPFGAGFVFRSDGLSVRYGTPPNSPPIYVNGAVSVRYGAPSNNPSTYINGAVSVRYGTPANQPSTEISGAVSASRGPVLTSLTPGTIARGTNVTLTIDGVALNGASSVSFYKLANGVHETSITVSNVNVNSQGTSLSATIAVASGVATGRYVIVVTTPAGSTVRNDVGSNAIQIN